MSDLVKWAILGLALLALLGTLMPFLVTAEQGLKAVGAFVAAPFGGGWWGDVRGDSKLSFIYAFNYGGHLVSGNIYGTGNAIEGVPSWWSWIWTLPASMVATLIASRIFNALRRILGSG